MITDAASACHPEPEAARGSSEGVGSDWCGDDNAIMARFDRLCALASANRRGLTLRQLGAAHALARVLEDPEYDLEHVADLAALLEVEVGALP